MQHAELPLANNAVETSASAFMYLLVETARADNLEPKAYLQALFEQYPLAKTEEQRRALLPMFFEFS